MRPLISARTAATIDRLRVAGWVASFTTSDPQVSIELYPVEQDTPRAAQDVVVEYRNAMDDESDPDTGAVTTSNEITFRRPLSMGFDVEIGDTFNLNGTYGTVKRVIERAGMIFAISEIDVGTT